MKLNKIDFYLDWPINVQVINLRKHVVENLMKKGKVIRWAIIDIHDSIDTSNTKKLRVKAVLADLELRK